MNNLRWKLCEETTTDKWNADFAGAVVVFFMCSQTWYERFFERMLRYWRNIPRAKRNYPKLNNNDKIAETKEILESRNHIASEQGKRASVSVFVLVCFDFIKDCVRFFSEGVPLIVSTRVYVFALHNQSQTRMTAASTGQVVSVCVCVCDVCIIEPIQSLPCSSLFAWNSAPT